MHTRAPRFTAATRPPASVQISDKNCEKIHYIAPNIYCCGAGTAADTEEITKLISSQLALLRLATRAGSRVVSAMTMLKRRLFQHQGQISAALVLGGVDVTGPHLYTIYPHGSTDKLPYVTMGSGSVRGGGGGGGGNWRRGEAAMLRCAALFSPPRRPPPSLPPPHVAARRHGRFRVGLPRRHAARRSRGARHRRHPRRHF